ncbi:MAG: DNA topoisomerase IV subunit A [Castellaniella sp.]
MQTELFPDFGGADGDERITLADYAEQAYLDYAVSVVRGRALPDLGDGQKPVQRRILYAMHAMGLGPGARPVKSARVVGDVLGKYHPHGDQAAYDALVRMAQDFTLRYPLIDGQGNFGSRDGDNAAAMRYTEARLTAFSRLLLDELGEGTVTFTANYDGSQMEPAALPARLPVMLLNGASGIAVGMATDIPSHHLGEVASACMALLENPDLDDAALFDLVPGPDFAGGAQIISPAEDIAQVYASGRGSIKVRARWHFEDRARGQWQCVITELPPGTSAQRVLEEIDEATNPRVRANRKGLTPQQQQTRTLMLGLLDGVRDESGKQDAVRLVLEPRSSRIDRDAFMNSLLAQTSLEGNVSINLVCLGLDGRPAQRSLREILLQWLEFRTATVTRRTRHRLDRVVDRIHVLEGRMVVYLNVDEVIRTIREAEDPRADLMAAFSLTGRQADDILDMRLRQLARLEGIRIEQELERQRKEEQKLSALLASPRRLRRLMVSEIEADVRTYGDERRTLIETASKAVIEQRIVREPVTVIASRKGWLRLRQGHDHDAAAFSFKAGDALYAALECQSTDMLIALSDAGRVHTVAVADLPSGRGDGQPITALADVESGTHIVHMMAGPPQRRQILGTQAGVGFLTTMEAMVSRQRAGKQFMTVEADDVLLHPLQVGESDSHLVLFSRQGRMLVVALQELRVLAAGGRGTRLMALDAGDVLSQWVCIGPAGLRVDGIYRRRPTTDVLDLDALAPWTGPRARKGRMLNSRIRDPQLSGA